jgi:hypothetical protein
MKITLYVADDLSIHMKDIIVKRIARMVEADRWMFPHWDIDITDHRELLEDGLGIKPHHHNVITKN